MPGDKKFDLGDYVEVKDRIRILFELFPQARIETDYHLTSEPDDRPKVIVRALVYRKPEDEKPAGHGTSWLYLPGTTSYTKGSEIENAETSAVGRAIGMLGILIVGGMASRQEIENKQDDGPATVKGFIGTEAHPAPTVTLDGGMVGKLVAEGNYDFELRQTPDGWRLPFRVKDGSKSFIVLAEDALAQALKTIGPTVLGQRVTVWGHWTDEKIPAKGTKPEIKYRILHLERIATPDGILPAPAFDSDEDLAGPPDDVELIAEAESLPMGLAS